jgi:hypothetical protein
MLGREEEYEVRMKHSEEARVERRREMEQREDKE